ncbi:MAG: glycosyltransferase [Flavobacteriaceae bacterium]|nr:glycosyltransferase [Flavobacteriaceae bacterium]
MSINDKPLVSIVMITYGHEKYIREAIEGVFLQKTNFSVELIISNDCSPDNTDEIVKEIIPNAPENIKVKYIRHSNNLGMIANHQWAIGQACGKYIVTIDGDDYWINKNKLQIQVDFLEQNPDYAICCHNFKILNGEILEEKSFLDELEIQETSTIEDLSKNNIIGTLTAVCKNEKVVFPEWTKDAPLGDLILFLNIAKKGKIKYFNEKWAVYRKNVGVWHSNKVNHKKMIELYHNLANDFSENKAVRDNLHLREKRHIKAFLKNQTIAEMFKSQYFKKLTYFEKVKLLIMNLSKQVNKLIDNQPLNSKIGGGVK